MLEAQNERRRRRGLPDRTEEDVAAEVRRDHDELRRAPRRSGRARAWRPRSRRDRVLIVGCGGRGQALARSLVEAGHAVRGTTRDAGAGRRDRGGGRGAVRRRPGPDRDADGGDRGRHRGGVAARDRDR